MTEQIWPDDRGYFGEFGGRFVSETLQAALAGAHIATVPYPVLQRMIQHPLTDRGIERFLADWARFYIPGGLMIWKSVKSIGKTPLNYWNACG